MTTDFNAVRDWEEHMNHPLDRAETRCQPCAWYVPHPDETPYHAHECPDCEGLRYRCGTCGRDHHEGGWNTCAELDCRHPACLAAYQTRHQVREQDAPCETTGCQHRCCTCGHAECGHANENVQPNCSECDCPEFVALKDSDQRSQECDQCSVDRADLFAALMLGYRLSCYTAAICWSEHETNSAEWLADLRLKIEEFQASAIDVLERVKDKA